MVAVGGPQEREEVAHDEGVGDRVEVVEVAVADLDHDGLPQQPHLAGLGVAFGGHCGACVEALAPGFVGEDDQAGGVVAPDSVEAVGDLTAPAAVHEGDHVERPRGHEAAVLGVALGEHLPEGGLDRIGRGALGAPYRVGGGRHRSEPQRRASVAVAGEGGDRGDTSDRAPGVALAQDGGGLGGPLGAGCVLR